MYVYQNATPFLFTETVRHSFNLCSEELYIEIEIRSFHFILQRKIVLENITIILIPSSIAKKMPHRLH